MLNRKHVLMLAAGVLVLGALPRPAAAQRKSQVEQPEITVYKVPT
jgi:hypothetical protein